MRATPPTYEGRRLPNPDEEIFDQGLSFDIETLLGRRRLLQVAGFSVLGAAMAACGLTSKSGSPSVATAVVPAHRVGERRHRHPGGDRGPVPGRRLERSRRPHPEWDRPQRHPLELRGHDRNGRRCSPDDRARDRRRVVGRSRREGRRLRVALRPGRAVLACTRSRTRTTSAASSRRTATGSSPSPASSRRATRVAGRTSTSRSIRIWRAARAGAAGSRPRRSRCPQDTCNEVYATDGYARASRTCSR